LVNPEDLPAYQLPEKSLEVAREGFRRAGVPVS